MYTITENPPKGRPRRTYSPAFRAERVAQCQQIGVSCSAVAISHGMNPNVLRRWIKEAQTGFAAKPPKAIMLDVQTDFVPLPIASAKASAQLRIELQRNGITVSVMWPSSRLEDSAAWVREILR
jgi:transposase